MAKKRIVTMLTDYGTRDGYVASIHGVLLSHAPDVEVVHVSHQIPPGDVLAGAFVLDQVYDYFPPGTIHLVVVDPGVGTDRRILAARYAGQTIVAPDNGLISLVDARLPMEAIVSVRNEQFFLARRVGATFDGRDVMAPVAAALARGVDIARLGPLPARYNLLDLPLPTWDGTTLAGQVMYIDAFGNCVTNITRAELERVIPQLARMEIAAKEVPVGPLVAAYAQVPPGQRLALLNSLDRLELAVHMGRACDVLGLAVGDKVCARYLDPTLPAQ